MENKKEKSSGIFSSAWFSLRGRYLSPWEFRVRLLVSFLLTIAVLILSPALSELFPSLRLSFTGDIWVLLFASLLLFVLGFLVLFKGTEAELKSRKPGMMVLYLLAISALFVYSVIVLFKTPEISLFWEMAILIDIFLVSERVLDPLPLASRREESRIGVYRLSDLSSSLLTIVTVFIAVLSFIIWYVILRNDFSFCFQRAVSVLVIVSPQAFSISALLVMTICNARLAGRGIMVVSSEALERARRIGAVVFSKTGILTEGRYGVADIEIFNPGMSRDDLVKYAASVEVHSKHPVARGVVEFAGDVFPVTGYRHIPGRGVMAKVQNRQVHVVTSSYLSEHKIRFDVNRLQRMKQGGRTVLYVLIENEVYGAIILSDVIRAQSRTAVSSLKAMGVKAFGLTADSRSVMSFISGELHLDGFFADVSPGEKVSKIQEVQYGGIITAMMGKAPEDAEPLARADISCPAGTQSSEASTRADMVFVNINPLDMVTIIKASKSLRRKILENLGWSFFFNMLALLLASGAIPAGVHVNPVAASLLMVFSVLIVILNSRRLEIN
ncbi:MAG: HAD-IC family P-type ATPase [Fibrobacter sp.]|jgi:Cu2+-exporting ATPase|nr:HAD-IC family P-type ATPase [Fibrobacter sp.]